MPANIFSCKEAGLELWLDVPILLFLLHSCQPCSSHLVSCCAKGACNYIAPGKTLLLDEGFFVFCFGFGSPSAPATASSMLLAKELLIKQSPVSMDVCPLRGTHAHKYFLELAGPQHHSAGQYCLKQQQPWMQNCQAPAGTLHIHTSVSVSCQSYNKICTFQFIPHICNMQVKFLSPGTDTSFISTAEQTTFPSYSV